MDQSKITIDEMFCPIASFELADTNIAIKGYGIGELRFVVSPISDPIRTMTFPARKTKNGSIELRPHAHESIQCYIDQIGETRLTDIVNEAANHITDEFETLAEIGMMKRDIQETLALNISLGNKLTEQEARRTMVRLEKLRARIKSQEATLGKHTEECSIEVPTSRWKASVDLEPLWSEMVDADSIRQYMPQLIELMESAGDLFAETDFVERLADIANQGDTKALSDIIDEIIDYANEHDIWIVG